MSDDSQLMSDSQLMTAVVVQAIEVAAPAMLFFL
jgi:hypothetical protein